MNEKNLVIVLAVGVGTRSFNLSNFGGTPLRTPLHTPLHIYCSQKITDPLTKPSQTNASDNFYQLNLTWKLTVKCNRNPPTDGRPVIIYINAVCLCSVCRCVKCENDILL